MIRNTYAVFQIKLAIHDVRSYFSLIIDILEKTSKYRITLKHFSIDMCSGKVMKLKRDMDGL